MTKGKPVRRFSGFWRSRFDFHFEGEGKRIPGIAFEASRPIISPVSKVQLFFVRETQLSGYVSLDWTFIKYKHEVLGYNGIRISWERSWAGNLCLLPCWSGNVEHLRQMIIELQFWGWEANRSALKNEKFVRVKFAS